MAYTETWDETKPAGSRDANLGDDDIREFKRALRERLAGGGQYFPSTDDADAGLYKWVKFIEQSSNPTSEANRAFLFTKDVSGVTELYWMDSAGTVTQLTSGGKILISSLVIASEARGDIITRGASAWQRKALGASGTFLKSDGTDPVWGSLILQGHLSGLVIENSGVDVTNDLSIAAGQAVDDTNAYLITLAAFTKRGDAAFSAGTGNGGGDITGSAGKRYVYLIGKSSDASAADVFFSTTAPGAVSLPSTWDIKRLIGIIYWGGSAWTTFLTQGSGRDRRIELYAGIQVLNAGTAGAFTDVDVSAYVDPTYCRLIHANVRSVSAGNSPGTAIRPNGSAEAFGQINYFNEADAFPGASNISTNGDIILDSNGIFEYYNVGTSSTIWIRGYTVSL